MIKILLLSLVLLSNAFAKDNFLDSVEREKWGDLEVVWVEDNRFPLFTASFYIQDGATHDKFPGHTQATFDQLTAGTSKMTQKEIAAFFDFYGAILKNVVTHEYSLFTVQALTRDIQPVMGKVCEVFNDAQYPKKVLQSYKGRGKSHLKNLGTNHSSLADRVFRAVTLNGTPYAMPVEGSLAGYEKLEPELLKARLSQINNSSKVLYLSGPPEAKKMKEILQNSCKWKTKSQITPIALTRPEPVSKIYLVPVSGANQAQIRIGRYVTQEEVKGKFEKFNFLAGFLGGGFTSKLVQELRVKRGLTYSAGAYVSMQRDYGRAGVTTFSKNETVAETISIIRDVLNEVGNGKFTPEEFNHQKGHEIGSYAFGFEETSAFLAQIMFYEHQGRDIKELVTFPKRIAALEPVDLAWAANVTFPWERLTIVVVGDKSLEKSLSKIRPVEILDYKNFL